jgi:RNA:NAD 2'-phosphotransferase (TPT1/KptA family)
MSNNSTVRTSKALSTILRHTAVTMQPIHIIERRRTFHAQGRVRPPKGHPGPQEI